jgi:predicted amidophosphoribosyltransferase
MFHQKESFKKQGLIEATQKITTSFSHNYLEKIWYVDFYSWEIFGKTLLGKLILHAKQNSDEVLMKRIAKEVQTPITDLIAREKFDMIGIIPHSVPRKKDFLRTTVKFLNLSPEPKRIFTKAFADHVVAQKTLKSKEERQENAEGTLFLNDEQIPKKILLIDDACGSGATLNVAAQKIKHRFPKTKVYGLTFVGSIKGFEVINEM